MLETFLAMCENLGPAHRGIELWQTADYEFPVGKFDLYRPK